MQTLVRDVLTAWREAERLQATELPGSPGQAAAAEAAIKLRDLYAKLTLEPHPDADVPAFRSFLEDLQRELGGGRSRLPPLRGGQSSS
jgi:hypothetical protein